MERFFAASMTSLRFAATLAMVWFSIASTRLGCGGDTNRATRAVPHTARWWVQRHLDKLDEAKRRAGQVDLLFVGDSITQDYEVAEPDRNFKPVWDDFFAPHRAMNLGFNGDETGQLLWRLRHGEADGLAPKDVVLLIGANNLWAEGKNPKVQTSDQIAAGTLAVVAEIHARMPAAHVLVLSILPSDVSAERSAKAVVINALVKEQVSHLPYARYLDVTGPFLDGSRFRAELFYDSRLHPSPAGQRMMAELVAAELYGH